MEMLSAIGGPNNEHLGSIGGDSAYGAFIPN